MTFWLCSSSVVHVWDKVYLDINRELLNGELIGSEREGNDSYSQLSQHRRRDSLKLKDNFRFFSLCTLVLLSSSNIKHSLLNFVTKEKFELIKYQKFWHSGGCEKPHGSLSFSEKVLLRPRRLESKFSQPTFLLKYHSTRNSNPLTVKMSQKSFLALFSLVI